MHAAQVSHPSPSAPYVSKRTQQVTQQSNKIKAFDNNHPGCLLVFGIFWTLFSAFFLWLSLDDGGICFGLFSVVFVLIGIAIIISALMVMFTHFKVGKPDFQFSRTTLKVGEPFTFSYSHTFPRSVTIGTITTHLIFREKATYQQGTDTKTVTHDHIILTRERPGGQFQAGHTIHHSYDLQIPPDAMHTLKVRRNELTWLVKFEANIANLPNYVKEFELTVLPEIARESKAW